MDRYFRIRGSLAGRGSPEDVTNDIHLPKGGGISHFFITIPFVTILFACSKKHYGCMDEEIECLKEEKRKEKEEKQLN